LEVEATLEDAGTFTKPWKQRSAWYLAPSDDVLEYVCSENNSDPKHMTAKVRADMMSKLLDENTANIEKAKSLTAGLSAAQLNWQPQPGKWSIAQNLAHLNFGYQYFDTLASSIAAARAKGIIGNGPFRYGWLSSWIMKSQEPPPKRKFKAAKATTPPPDVDAAKALADYLRMTARLGELIQEADGLDLARAKTPWPFKWTKMPLGALLTHMITHAAAISGMPNKSATTPISP
jgi:hypothetical protein